MREKGTYHYSIRNDVDTKKLDALIEEIKESAKYVFGTRGGSVSTEIFVMRGSNVFTFRRFNDENSTIDFGYTKNAFYDSMYLPFILQLCDEEKYAFEPKQENSGKVRK